MEANAVAELMSLLPTTEVSPSQLNKIRDYLAKALGPSYGRSRHLDHAISNLALGRPLVTDIKAESSSVRSVMTPTTSRSDGEAEEAKEKVNIHDTQVNQLKRDLMRDVLDAQQETIAAQKAHLETMRAMCLASKNKHLSNLTDGIKCEDSIGAPTVLSCELPPWTTPQQMPSYMPHVSWSDAEKPDLEDYITDDGFTISGHSDHKHEKASMDFRNTPSTSIRPDWVRCIENDTKQVFRILKTAMEHQEEIECQLPTVTVGNPHVARLGWKATHALRSAYDAFQDLVHAMPQPHRQKPKGGKYHGFVKKPSGESLLPSGFIW